MRSLHVLLGSLMLLSLQPSIEAAAQSLFFQELMMVAPPAVRFGDAAWGDYDRDGDLDLILTGSLRPFDNPNPLTQLYRNEGNTQILVTDPTTGGTVEVEVALFVDAINLTLPILEDVWQSAAAWGDYSNDGILDLAVTGLNTAGVPSLWVYEFVGGTTLLLRRYPLSGVYAGDLAWADYDTDGDLDLVACGFDHAETPVLTFYENQVNDDAGFVPREGLLDGLASCDLDWGDYDRDGDPDLLVTGIDAQRAFSTRIYRNDGGGLFTDAAAGLKGLLFAAVAWGDYDADGDLDIVLSGAQLTPFLLEGQFNVYRNDGGTFTEIDDALMGSFENEPTPGRYQSTIDWGDFDNNGFLDFLVTGLTDPQGPERLQIYQNNGNGQFTKSPTERFDGGILGGASWGDYDLDDDLDILVFGEDLLGGVGINTLRNGLSFGKTAPSVPEGLQATPEGDAVTFTWNPATDIQTPTPGLTYNLRVGTTPGDNDVVSAMAEASGRRHLSQRGNAGHNTQWTLRGLPPGTYFWSVQTLDNSFSASPFAPEGTFTVGTTQTAINSGYSFGECLGYCVTEFFLTSEQMTLVKRPWFPEDAFPEKRLEEPMDPALWQRLIQLIDVEMLASLPDVFGCPDCADSGAEWIEVIQGDQRKKITFDYDDDTPEPIATLIEEITRIRQALEEAL